MSDGQSFYIILAVFYFIDCFKFTPPEAMAFSSRWAFRQGRRWSPRSVVLTLAGIGKIAFLAPLLPWPGVLLTPAKKEMSGPTRHPRNIRRLIKLLVQSTADLRLLGLIVFLHFFILIPLVYIQHRGELLVLATIAVGYLFLSTAAIMFYRLHKRLLPQEQAERFKATLYTAMLPWHGMRCADEILVRYSLGWCKLSFLVTHASEPENLEKLQRLWRESHFLPSAEYRVEEIASPLAEESLDPSSWLDRPELTDGSRFYCPCCHLGYAAPTQTCADCDDIDLLPAIPATVPPE